MTKLLHRADFWAKVVKTVQLLGGLFQVGTLGPSEINNVEVVPIEWNLLAAGIQVLAAILSFWTVDDNRDNVIDIVQDPVTTTITTTVTAPKGSSIETETEETKDE